MALGCLKKALSFWSLFLTAEPVFHTPRSPSLVLDPGASAPGACVFVLADFFGKYLSSPRSVNRPSSLLTELVRSLRLESFNCAEKFQVHQVSQQVAESCLIPTRRRFRQLRLPRYFRRLPRNNNNSFISFNNSSNNHNNNNNNNHHHSMLPPQL